MIEQRSHWAGSKNWWVSSTRMQKCKRFQIFFCSSPIASDHSFWNIVTDQFHLLSSMDSTAWVQIEYVDHWPKRLGAAHATGPSEWKPSCGKELQRCQMRVLMLERQSGFSLKFLLETDLISILILPDSCTPT